MVNKCSLEDQEAVSALCGFLNELASIGITTQEQMEEYITNYRNKEATLEANTELYQNACDEYKKLKRVAYNINLAQNPRYIYGPKFEEEDKIDFTKLTAEIDDLKLKNEEKEIDAEIEKEEKENKGKDYTQEDEYFESKDTREEPR